MSCGCVCSRITARLRSGGAGRFASAALIVSWLVVPAVAQSEEPAPEAPDLLAPLTDPTDDWRVRRTFSGRLLTVYGQLNPAIVGFSDGAGATTYAPVNSSNSSARIGFYWELPSLRDIGPVLRAEVGLPVRRSGSISQTNTGGSWFDEDFNIRKLEVIVDNPRWGTLTLGQGSMANDGIAEIDLSRTDVAAYSGVAAPAASQLFRLADGSLSDVTIGNAFDNFDGDNITGENADGSRKVRVRYDTPELRGFKLAMAVGKDVQDGLPETFADVALRYEYRGSDWHVSSGLGYSKKGIRRINSGSVSALHLSTGLTLTAAAGSSRRAGNYGYAKIGVLRDELAIGPTAFSVDIYRGWDVVGAGSRSNSVALAVTQHIEDWNSEIYGFVRRYKLDRPGNSYQPMRVIMAGMRWKF